MASEADVRRLALALPEAYEDTHRGTPSFRVRTKIFAMLSLFPGGKPGGAPVATLKLDREDQINLAAAFPGAVEPVPTWGRHGWTHVRYDRLDTPALEGLLRTAWRHRRLSSATQPG